MRMKFGKLLHHGVTLKWQGCPTSAWCRLSSVKNLQKQLKCGRQSHTSRLGQSGRQGTTWSCKGYLGVRRWSSETFRCCAKNKHSCMHACIQMKRIGLIVWNDRNRMPVYHACIYACPVFLCRTAIFQEKGYTAILSIGYSRVQFPPKYSSRTKVSISTEFRYFLFTIATLILSAFFFDHSMCILICNCTYQNRDGWILYTVMDG